MRIRTRIWELLTALILVIVVLTVAIPGSTPLSVIWNAGRARTPAPTDLSLSSEIPSLYGKDAKSYEWSMLYAVNGVGLVQVAHGTIEPSCAQATEIVDDSAVVEAEISGSSARNDADLIPWYAGAFASAYAYAPNAGTCTMLQTLPLIWSTSPQDPMLWIEDGLPLPGMGHLGAPSRDGVYGMLSSMNEIPAWSPAWNSFHRPSLVVERDATNGTIVLSATARGTEFQRLVLRELP